MANQYDIFISYRREGGAHYARILKAELEKRGYKDRVFLDYDELKDGRFDSRIMAAIDSAPLFIFILSPGALDRCVNENDWVRQEIIYALEHERHIIPINFDGLFSGFPRSVPREVRDALGQHQFSKIDSESLLNVSIEKLINERLAPIVAPKEYLSQRAIGAEIIIIPDVDCQIFRFNKFLSNAKADSETMIRLLKGNHLLEFVSVQCPEVKERRKYSVPDNDYSDFFEIKLKSQVVDKLNLYPYVNATGKWGFVNQAGKFIIPCIYDGAKGFSEGQACVKKNDKYGVIDKLGNFVIPCISECIIDFSEGLASVMKNNKWGFIDRTGKLVIPCIYDKAFCFSEGLASVMKNNKWGFIDRTGKLVIPCIYDEALYFSEGLAHVKMGERYGFIDRSGKLVVPCIYDHSDDFSEGLASVMNNNKYGFIDRTGKLVIPSIYDETLCFSEGLASVMKNNKYGFIDRTGKLVIPCIYDEALCFSEGLASVMKNNKYGFIDRTGKLVIPCIFDNAEKFFKGWAPVEKDYKWGIIDKTGKIALPFVFDILSTSLISENIEYTLKCDDSDKICYIDTKGQIVVPLGL